MTAEDYARLEGDGFDRGVWTALWDRIPKRRRAGIITFVLNHLHAMETEGRVRVRWSYERAEREAADEPEGPGDFPGDTINLQATFVIGYEQPDPPDSPRFALNPSNDATDPPPVCRPLDQLDDVDWASLAHAYGPASDLPGLLCDLRSDTPADRNKAMRALSGTIWHQGTVYPATAAAVPFLYGLLATPGPQDRPGIADLLARIARGTGYLEVHAVGPLGERMWREILAKEGKTLEAELSREREEIAAVRRAVSAGLRGLLPYLRGGEPHVRRAVAAAFTNYPEHRPWTLGALDETLASEANAGVRQWLSECRAVLLGQVD